MTQSEQYLQFLLFENLKTTAKRHYLTMKQGDRENFKSDINSFSLTHLVTLSPIAVKLS